MTDARSDTKAGQYRDDATPADREHNERLNRGEFDPTLNALSGGQRYRRDTEARQFNEFSGDLTDTPDPDELMRWADRYGHPEWWAKRAMKLHGDLERVTAERDRLETDLRELLDHRKSSARAVRAESERDQAWNWVKAAEESRERLMTQRNILIDHVGRETAAQLLKGTEGQTSQTSGVDSAEVPPVPPESSHDAWRNDEEAQALIDTIESPADPHRENQAMTNDALIAAAKALIEEWKRYANDPDLTTPHWVTPYLRALNEALPDSDERNADE